MTDAHAGKVVDVATLRDLREAARARGETVVHCHGCFDIVHPGHIRHLRHARELGARLVVSVTADAFVGKGDGRPMFCEALRAENLAALAMVDWVCVSDAPTALPLLEALRPDVYVKGREYESNADPRFVAERDAVERHGGRVVFSSGDVVFSSTRLVAAVQRDPGGSGLEHPVAARLRAVSRDHDLSVSSASGLLGSIRGLRVVIVGEPIVDRYVSCDWPRVAGEAPMLSLRPIEQTSFDGGAAVVALHAAALGARPVLVAPRPSCAEADAMDRRLTEAGVELCPLAVDGPMPVKERLLVGREKLVKIDRVKALTLDARARARWVAMAEEHARGADAAIVVDYGCGALGPTLVGELFTRLRPLVRTLAGDVSGGLPSLAAMHDADWLSPTEAELRQAAGQSDKSLAAVAWDLARTAGARHVVVTMGPDGLIAFRRLPEPQAIAAANDGAPSMLSGAPIPALTDAPADTLGCGDALLTAGVLALARGADIVQAAFLGSAAAAVAAESLGNRPIDRARVLEVVRRHAIERPVVHTINAVPARRVG